MNILGLITAKVDSARVPHKNFIRIAGKPLYKWTTDFLSENQDCFTALAFSSDEPDKFDVPFNFFTIKRPPNLCIESASHRSVVIHALDYIGHYFEEFDYVMLFQPTNPFRRKIDLYEMMVKMKKSIDLTSGHMYYLDNNLRAEYIYGMNAGCDVMVRSGYIYMYSVPYLRRYVDDYGTIILSIPKWRGYNINTKEDFYVAEALYEANNA